ncbi:MAG TPA: DUF971 domain-containing protein [Terracidiphilus sp.]|jgi:DUF971 family protein
MSHEGIRFTSKEDQEREDKQNRPLPKVAVTPEKVRVKITEGTGLEVDWLDGHKSAWNFAWLRDACPCATCIDERKAQVRKAGQSKPKGAALLPMYTPPSKPASAHGVGRYAIQFNWQDGHSGGIYSWDYLRRHCQCAECRFEAEESTGTPN